MEAIWVQWTYCDSQDDSWDDLSFVKSVSNNTQVSTFKWPSTGAKDPKIYYQISLTSLHHLLGGSMLSWSSHLNVAAEICTHQTRWFLIFLNFFWNTKPATPYTMSLNHLSSPFLVWMSLGHLYQDCRPKCTEELLQCNWLICTSESRAVECIFQRSVNFFSCGIYEM